MAKLTPGERVKNWTSAFMTLWPAWALVLGTLGYTNADEVKGLIFTSQNEKIVGLTPFEQYVREEIERIDMEEAEGRAIGLSQTNSAKKQLAGQLKSQNKKIEKIRELVN